MCYVRAWASQTGRTQLIQIKIHAKIGRLKATKSLTLLTV